MPRRPLQSLVVPMPPIVALAVPPVTVLWRAVSVGNSAGHFEGVTFVDLEVPVDVRPLSHVMLKDLPSLLEVTVPPPPEIFVWLHPVARPVPMSPSPVKPVHVTTVGVAAEAKLAGRTVNIAGTASEAASEITVRRT